MDESLVIFMKKLNNVHVRNIYWLLFSPSPIAEYSLDDIPLFPEKWLWKLEKENRTFFEELDVNSTALEEVVDGMKTSRLGLYAEVLLGYFFQHSPSTELVLHNFQLIEDKTTLGEIDFVIQLEGKLIHIELAIKFYLGKEPTDQFANWIGPSGNDNLHAKLNKIRTHQLPIAKSDKFKEQTGLIVESYFLLKGSFYTKNNFFPSWKNELANFYNFFYYSEFLKELYQNKSDFLILLRPQWMSTGIDPLLEHCETFPTTIEVFRDYFHHYGALYVFDLNKKETFFIVADNWPT